MTGVFVNTDKTKWGHTHLVRGKKKEVRKWCRQLVDSSSYRVHCREIEENADGTVTYRADVDSSCHVPAQPQSSGPGLFTCLAIGVGLGWLFGA
jgi:hypothetical protein